MPNHEVAKPRSEDRRVPAAMSEQRGGERRKAGARGQAADLRAALERALRHEPATLARLSYARTSVCFQVDDAPGITLLLDRDPAQVVDDEPAEIEITLTAQQAGDLARGRLPMPRAIVTHAVTAKGPVRKYLEVDPMLQARLQQTAPADSSNGHHPQPHAEPIDRIDESVLAIETRDLHKRFGEQAVLEGVDLQIPEGVISVVLGPSGTGKSVLLQHIIGLMTPDAGDVLVRGRALNRMSRSELLGLRRDIGVMFQDGALFSAMNVYDNVAFPLRQHTDLNETEIRQVVEEALASVGLGDAHARLPAQLSGGMRKRAGLARALIVEPGVLLVDEPDSGLDPVRTALLGDLLVEQHARHGGTMVVVTHNVMLARSIADHMSILWRGRVLESGMTEQIMASGTEFVRQFLAGEAKGPLGMDA